MLINRFNKQLFLIFQVFVLIELILPTFAIAQDNSSSSKRIIKFGFAEDAYPISALATHSGTELDNDTLCYQLYEHLKNKFPQYDFKITPIGYKNRLQPEINLDINCGSFSVTEERKNTLKAKDTMFSIKYFTTSSKYILRKGEEDLQTKLEEKEDLPQGKKIAVIENTTQHHSLTKYYQENSDLISFDKRNELYDKIINNQEIIAYITKEKLAIIIYKIRELNFDLYYEINDWIDEHGKQWITEKNDELDSKLTDTLNKEDSKGEVPKPTKKDINIYIYFYVGTVIILLTFLIFLLIKIKSSSIIINNHSGGGDNVGNNKNIEN